MAPRTPRRWDEIEAARRQPEGETSPERDAFLSDLLVFCEHPFYPRFVAMLARAVEDVTIDPTDPNAGALFRMEGRRSLYRVIRDLPANTREKLQHGRAGDE